MTEEAAAAESSERKGAPWKRALSTLVKVAISALLLAWVGSQLSWTDTFTTPDGEVLARGFLELPDDAEPGVTPDTAVLVTATGAREVQTGDAEVHWGVRSYLQHARHELLLVALLVLAVPLAATSVRLWILLRVAGVKLTLWRVFVATIAGNFFSIVLPGAIGGDLPKALLLSRGSEAKAEGVAMLVADRVVGAFSLILLGALAALTAIDDPNVTRPGLTLLAFVGLTIVGGLVYAAEPLRKLLRITTVLEMLPGGAILARMDRAVRTVLRHPRAMLAGVTLSLLSHGSTVLCWVALARAFGVETSLAVLAVYVPLILLASTLPISFGGWGVREKTSEMLFGAAGIASEVAIAVSVLYGSIYILWALPGGVLMLAERRRAES